VSPLAGIEHEAARWTVAGKERRRRAFAAMLGEGATLPTAVQRGESCSILARRDTGLPRGDGKGALARVTAETKTRTSPRGRDPRAGTRAAV